MSTTRRTGALPYLLVAPAVAVLGVMLGYPLYRLGQLAVRDYGLKQVFGAPAELIGLANFTEIFGDHEFWTVLWRTVLFCAACVVLTIVIGTLVALLLDALGTKMRVFVSTSLILAWAMPPLSATIVWQWLFDTQYGFVNWLLRTPRHGWFAEPLTFFMVALIIVVWMGVPFVAFTLYAGLTQIPDSLVEAAHLDGARAGQRFRYVIYPMLKPILLIVTSLSVLWDFRVFTQIYVLQKAGGISRETNLLGVYAYRISIGENQFGVGAAVAIVMVLFTVMLTITYLRAMLREDPA